MKESKIYLNSILECVERIEEYTGDGKDAFFDSRLLQDAVIRNLEVIGEAVKQIPDDLKQAYPDIPWKAIAGLRDILIHDYLKVNLQRVWQVIEDDLSPLKVRVLAILENMS